MHDEASLPERCRRNAGYVARLRRIAHRRPDVGRCRLRRSRAEQFGGALGLHDGRIDQRDAVAERGSKVRFEHGIVRAAEDDRVEIERQMRADLGDGRARLRRRRLRRPRRAARAPAPAPRRRRSRRCARAACGRTNRRRPLPPSRRRRRAEIRRARTAMAADSIRSSTGARESASRSARRSRMTCCRP